MYIYHTPPYLYTIHLCEIYTHYSICNIYNILPCMFVHPYIYLYLLYIPHNCNAPVHPSYICTPHTPICLPSPYAPPYVCTLLICLYVPHISIQHPYSHMLPKTICPHMSVDSLYFHMSPTSV